LQLALPRFELSKEVVVLGFIWGAFALAAPTRIGNFEFRHFVNEDGLTLNVSRSAPPMAVLEDEKLSPIKTEPSENIVATRGIHTIGSGTDMAWPKLRKYSMSFERRAARFARQHRRSNFGVKVTSISNAISVVPLLPQHISNLYAVTVVDSQKALPVLSIVKPASLAIDVGQVQGPKTETVHEASAPTVNFVPQAFAKPALRAPKSVAQNNYVPSRGQASVTAVDPDKLRRQSIIEGAVRAGFSPDKAPSDIQGLDGGKKRSAATVTQQSADDYHVVGQIELSGGLAATGSNTKVDIQWQGLAQNRVGVVDYSSGQFDIAVPNLRIAKVTARLLDESGYVLGTGEYDIEDNEAPGQKTLQGISILIEPRESTINGKVVSAYNVGSAVVPVIGSSVFAGGSARDMADKNGNFRLSGLSSQSTFAFEAYAPEHWSTRILSTAKRTLHIPVFAVKMMDSFFGLIGKDADRSDFGVVWGEVKKKNQTVAGVQVVSTAQGAVGPIYFNELRIPDKTLKATTSNGLFAFAKVKPGLQVISAQSNGKEIPSTVVSVAASKVSYSEISFKATTIQGQVIDPILKTTLTAQVGVVGALASTNSDSNGFTLKIPSSDPMLFVEAQGSDEYMKSRTTIAKPEAKNVELPLYKKTWLKEKLAKANAKFTPDQTIFVGYVSGPEFHVQLDDSLDPTVSADKAEPQIYYFNKKGDIDSTMLSGSEGGNAFIITNLPPGLHTLIITSASGDLTVSRLFASDNGVANVMALELKP
jgi:hypothetical protein